jgi:peptidoglycan/LPS O-acetylase OafA/YrhL
LLLAGLGRGTAVGVLHAGGWLVNATMLQGLLGVPHALGIYWTLTCELVFYLAVSLLYLVLPWPALTAALWITTTVIVATLTHRLVELPAVRLGRTLGARPARTATAGEPAVPPLLQFPSASGRPAPRPSLSTAAAGSSS